MKQAFYTNIDNQLQKIVEDKLLKTEKVITSPQAPDVTLSGGNHLINFCANNYLGLAQIQK